MRPLCTFTFTYLSYVHLCMLAYHQCAQMCELEGRVQQLSPKVESFIFMYLSWVYSCMLCLPPVCPDLWAGGSRTAAIGRGGKLNKTAARTGETTCRAGRPSRKATGRPTWCTGKVWTWQIYLQGYGKNTTTNIVLSSVLIGSSKVSAWDTVKCL